MFRVLGLGFGFKVLGVDSRFLGLGFLFRVWVLGFGFWV